MEITVKLTDTEYKALSVVAVDPQEWVDNAVKERCRLAIEDIVQKEVSRRLTAGEPIPSSRDDLVLSPKVKTAAELEAEFEASQVEVSL